MYDTHWPIFNCQGPASGSWSPVSEAFKAVPCSSTPSSLQKTLSPKRRKIVQFFYQTSATTSVHLMRIGVPHKLCRRQNFSSVSGRSTAERTSSNHSFPILLRKHTLAHYRIFSCCSISVLLCYKLKPLHRKSIRTTVLLIDVSFSHINLLLHCHPASLLFAAVFIDIKTDTKTYPTSTSRILLQPLRDVMSIMDDAITLTLLI